MTFSYLALAVAGAGAFHSLSGPDHLAALAPLALRTSGPGRAFRQGKDSSGFNVE